MLTYDARRQKYRPSIYALAAALLNAVLTLLLFLLSIIERTVIKIFVLAA